MIWFLRIAFIGVLIAMLCVTSWSIILDGGLDGC